MDIGAILMGMALLALTIPMVVQPFRQSSPKRVEPDGHKGQGARNGKDLEPQREQVLVALRDLDFDYQTGKVVEQDYTILRSELLAQAAELIQSQEAEDEAIEKLIRARRKGLSKVEVGRCSQCGRKLSLDDRFCPGCGEPAGLACPQCGRSITLEDRFCSACGEQIAVKDQVQD